MSLFDRIFGNNKEPKKVAQYFRLLNGYTPTFTSWSGSIYESELCRAAIDASARHASKLKPEITGSVMTTLTRAPSKWQTWSQFLYRTMTILQTDNTCFIVPIFDGKRNITGIYPIAPQSWELVTAEGIEWIRFSFSGGQRSAVELSKVGILTRYQYRSDFFGEDNSALRDTMQLIKIQRQGIEEAAKNSASYRFMARVNNFTKAEDLKKESDRFSEANFQESGGGLLLFPNTYADIKELSTRTYSVDADQQKLIQTNVYNYFGVNEDVMQNKAYGDAWAAFYEGAIEPFAIQCSEVITRMLFSEHAQAFGSSFFLSSSRLQYMSTGDKTTITTDLLDRGIISINEARDIWQLPPIEGGDVHIIRGEYYSTEDKLTTIKEDQEDGQE